MELLHDSPDRTRQPAAETPPLRFRAATVEQALSEARAELGTDVEIVDANRIRRGGVGGFFATDLGIELSIRPVAAHAPPLPQAGFDPESREQDHLDDRIDDDFESRLARLDRAIYGESEPCGIDRLLDRATGADGFERRTASTEPISFAEHLDRQLADPETAPLPRREPRAGVGGRPATTPSVGPIRAGANMMTIARNPNTDPTRERSAPPVRDARESDRRHIDDTGAMAVPAAGAHGDVLTERAATTEPAVSLQPIPQRSSAARSRPQAAGVEREAPDFGHHADLAAGAVGRLIGELSRIAPTTGSRVNQLSRLTVSLTAADGSSVEFSAELNGSHDG